MFFLLLSLGPCPKVRASLCAPIMSAPTLLAKIRQGLECVFKSKIPIYYPNKKIMSKEFYCILSRFSILVSERYLRKQIWVLCFMQLLMWSLLLSIEDWPKVRASLCAPFMSAPTFLVKIRLQLKCLYKSNALA